MKHSIVVKFYKNFNRGYFNDKLTMPTILFTRNTRHDGWYQAKSGNLSRSILVVNPDQSKEDMLDTLHHEMCHQYIEEILKVEEVDDHGPLFQHIFGEDYYG